MQAGKLNRLVTLERMTITYDTYNEPTETWASAGTIWAEVITSGGKEFYAAQKLNAETSAVFRVRYTQKIQVVMRIKWGNRIFQILSLNELDGMRKELLISAKEVV